MKLNNNISYEEVNKKPLITVKQILEECWPDYVVNHEVEDYQIREVDKALNCYGDKNGCFVFYCNHCERYIFQHYGCNSRLCSCCGKRYADQWSASLAKSMFPVPHRHIVFSIPSELWDFLRDKSLWKDYMDCARTCFYNYIPKMLKRMLRKVWDLEVGIVCILHPFGKDMKFHPHLHLLITEGGFDIKGKFHKINFFPSDGFRKCWRYVVMQKFQELGFPNWKATELFDKYPNGFYVWVHKRGRIRHPKMIASYVGRYVRHPAIANRRITYFNGRDVHFYYDQEGDIIDVFMTSEQFISALIQHIPPPNFKMVRYYLAYSRRRKTCFFDKKQSGIKQLTLNKFGLIKEIRCPICKNNLIFIHYSPKPPSKELPIQRELEIWIN